jgi:hypothetical protein
MENTQFCWHYALQNRSRLILIDHQFSSQTFKNANLIERLVSTIVQYHRQKRDEGRLWKTKFLQT